LAQYTSNDFNDLHGVCECIHVLDSRRATPKNRKAEIRRQPWFRQANSVLLAVH